LQQAISRFTRVGIVRLSLVGIGLLALVTVVGCGGGTKKWQVVMTPTSTLNQDDNGASLPVLVRVYQLRGKEKFQQAPFKSLWKNDKDALEGDLVERKEITVHPATQTVLDLDLDARQGAAFVGVMVLFRKPDVEGWKYVEAAQSSALNPFTPKIKLVLDGNKVKLAD